MLELALDALHEIRRSPQHLTANITPMDKSFRQNASAGVIEALDNELVLPNRSAAARCFWKLGYLALARLLALSLSKTKTISFSLVRGCPVHCVDFSQAGHNNKNSVPVLGNSWPQIGISSTLIKPKARLGQPIRSRISLHPIRQCPPHTYCSDYDFLPGDQGGFATRTHNLRLRSAITLRTSLKGRPKN